MGISHDTDDGWQTTDGNENGGNHRDKDVVEDEIKIILEEQLKTKPIKISVS